MGKSSNEMKMSGTRKIHLDIEQVSVAHEVVPPDSTLLTNHPTHPVLGNLREEDIRRRGHTYVYVYSIYSVYIYV